MAKKEKDKHPALIPLYLGITGHRDLHEADKPRLREMIKEIILKKKAQCPNTPVIILTPLAEGADRLGAYAAMDCGISFIAPLPMPVDEYRKDFTSKESLDEFNTLLEKADLWFELPLHKGTSLRDLQRVKEKRDQQYYLNGLFIARQSQTLIALWDGFDNEKQGGTAHIVKLKRSGLPSSHPQLQQRLQNLQSGPICHIVTPCKSSPKPDRPFGMTTIYSDYWSRERHKPEEMDRQLLTHIDTYNQDVRKMDARTVEEIRQSETNLLMGKYSPQTDPTLQKIAKYHAVTDSLANTFKKKQLLALRMLLTLSVIALLFFIIYLTVLQHPLILLLYPVTISLGALWFIRSYTRKYRQKHADYRALAEAFRVQYFLSIARKKVDVSEYYLQKHKGELEWRIYALRAALLKSHAKNIIYDAKNEESSLQECSDIKERWVSGQLSYYGKTSKRLRRIDRNLRYMGNILFYGSVVLALFLALFHTKAGNPAFFSSVPGNWIQQVLVLCTAGFLVISGAIFGYKEIMAFADRSVTFEKMYSLFRTAADKLDQAIASQNHKESVEIVLELAHESLMENLEAHQQELQVVNTLMEEQKEELAKQKEELQEALENLRKAQQQLVESEKMAALGSLVAGVAHEVNTPIGICITAFSTLRDDVEKMADLFRRNEISREDFMEFLQSTREAGHLIQKNLERTASLVQSFKQVSADQVTEERRTFFLHEYLNDILVSLKPKFGQTNIDLIVHCDDSLQLNSYPGVFAQILTNLLLNSLQHGFYDQDKGTVTIRAQIESDMLQISYEDDGKGISKENLPRIFDPFFTSDQRRGSGLGLHIIYNLIRQKLKGTITCESEPGKGVLFNVLLPLE